MSEILVIRVNRPYMNPEYMKYLRRQIIKQKEEKVVLLPYFCEPMIVSEDVDIRVEEDDKE